MKKTLIQPILPVGYPTKTAWATLLLWLLPGIFTNFCFFYRYDLAYQALYEWEDGVKYFSGVSMVPFSSLMGWSLYGCFAAALAMIPLAWSYWRYHYQGSHSIYTMKRIPQRWELWRRCLVLPLAGVVLYLVEALLLREIDFLIYWFITPIRCLDPHQWAALWGGI